MATFLSFPPSRPLSVFLLCVTSQLPPYGTDLQHPQMTLSCSDTLRPNEDLIPSFHFLNLEAIVKICFRQSKELPRPESTWSLSQRPKGQADDFISEASSTDDGEYVDPRTLLVMTKLESQTFSPHWQ
ncbi:hypothetical protein B0H14DRAFT_2635329 [Mycena olivaceomarginata]|nr:hypothetical protein B0H14DRAFT_2635329 [Mycena olivaceomarginata]